MNDYFYSLEMLLSDSFHDCASPDLLECLINLPKENAQ